MHRLVGNRSVYHKAAAKSGQGDTRLDQVMALSCHPLPAIGRATRCRKEECEIHVDGQDDYGRFDPGTRVGGRGLRQSFPSKNQTDCGKAKNQAGIWKRQPAASCVPTCGLVLHLASSHSSLASSNHPAEMNRDIDDIHNVAGV